MASRKTSKTVKRKARSSTFQVGGTVSIDRLKEVLQREDEVEFSVTTARRDRNLALDLALLGRKADEQR